MNYLKTNIATKKTRTHFNMKRQQNFNLSKNQQTNDCFHNHDRCLFKIYDRVSSIECENNEIGKRIINRSKCLFLFSIQRLVVATMDRSRQKHQRQI